MALFAIENVPEQIMACWTIYFKRSVGLLVGTKWMSV